MMKVDILTIFPKMFAGPFEESLIGKGQQKGFVRIKIHDLRRWSKDKHKTVDDRPYGGGPGMLMMVEPIDQALNELKGKGPFVSTQSKLRAKGKIVLLSAKGERFSQQKARELAKLKHLILICGHYEGVDERVRQHLVGEDISIGDYVLTGGELPAMVVVDAIVRLIPGVVGKSSSLVEESHNKPGYIEYPQYTRPENYKGWKVPKALLSGDHKKIEEWRKKRARGQTKSGS